MRVITTAYLAILTVILMALKKFAYTEQDVDSWPKGNQIKDETPTEVQDIIEYWKQSTFALQVHRTQRF